MPGCIIIKSIIKSHVINTGSIIEHDNFLDNFTSVGPGSILWKCKDLIIITYWNWSIVLQKLRLSKFFIRCWIIINKIYQKILFILQTS